MINSIYQLRYVYIERVPNVSNNIQSGCNIYCANIVDTCII